jgi:hypothetical protein
MSQIKYLAFVNLFQRKISLCTCGNKSLISLYFALSKIVDSTKT